MTLFSSPASAEALDSLWRIELLHPVVVHFPVALITVGAAFWLAGRLASADGRGGFLRPSARTLLILGAVGAWAAVLSGFWAEDAVGPSVLNAPLLRDHQDLAITTAILASLLAMAEVGRSALTRRRPRRRLQRAAHGVTAALLLATVVSLALAAHHGAALVYAEGAAVQPVSR